MIEVLQEAETANLKKNMKHPVTDPFSGPGGFTSESIAAQQRVKCGL